MTSRSSPRCAPGRMATYYKGAVQEETLRAIHAVASGEAIFGPAVASRLMHYFFRSVRPAGKSGPTHFFPELTERNTNYRLHRSEEVQCGDCGPVRFKPQDGARSRLQHLEQAAGGRPGRSDACGLGRGIVGQIPSEGS